MTDEAGTRAAIGLFANGSGIVVVQRPRAERPMLM
jgi:hypothetical protein